MHFAHDGYAFTFKAFDIIKQKYFYYNANTYESAKKFRDLILTSSRYKSVGNIYERDISKPFVY